MTSCNLIKDKEECPIIDLVIGTLEKKHLFFYPTNIAVKFHLAYSCSVQQNKLLCDYHKIHVSDWYVYTKISTAKKNNYSVYLLLLK